MPTLLSAKKSMVLPWTLMLLPLGIPIVWLLVSIVFYKKWTSWTLNEQMIVIRGFINWGLWILMLLSIFLFFIWIYLYRKRNAENLVVDNWWVPTRIAPEWTEVIPNTFAGIFKLWRKALWKGPKKRLSAGEYYLALLRVWLVQSANGGLLFFATSVSPEIAQIMEMLFRVVYVITILISLSLIIKRQHDLDKPRYHLFLIIIPIYNIYYIIKLVFREGTPWTNTYGDDPLRVQPKSDKRYRVIWICFTLLNIVPSFFIQRSIISELSSFDAWETIDSSAVIDDEVKNKAQ